MAQSGQEMEPRPRGRYLLKRAAKSKRGSPSCRIGSSQAELRRAWGRGDVGASTDGQMGKSLAGPVWQRAKMDYQRVFQASR